MDTLDSQYLDLSEVKFPKFEFRQVCMHPFKIENPTMGESFKEYTSLVKKLCFSAGFTSGDAYLTIDEKIVETGWSQRRPRAHVDGRMEASRWGHQGPTWIHFKNGNPIKRTAIIVAASHVGCIAYRGLFHGWPKLDGDLEHIRNQFGRGDMLPANRAFLLTPDCVHESITFDKPTRRAFLRIALPNE